MKKIKFTLFSLRDLLVAFGPMLLVLCIIVGAAYYLVDPAPDRVIELSAGPENSSYQRFAKLYATELAKNKVTLHINPSQGSQENLQKISDPDSAIQVGLFVVVQPKHKPQKIKVWCRSAACFMSRFGFFIAAQKSSIPLAISKVSALTLAQKVMACTGFFRRY